MFHRRRKWAGTVNENQKSFITIRLVKESEEKSNEEIEKEIFESLSKGLSRIPWLAEIEKVTVREGLKAIKEHCENLVRRMLWISTN